PGLRPCLRRPPAPPRARARGQCWVVVQKARRGRPGETSPYVVPAGVTQPHDDPRTGGSVRHQRHHRPRMTHYAMSAGLLAAVKPRFEAFTRHEGGHLLWQLEMHRGAWGRLYVDGRSWSAAAIAWVLDGRPLVVGSRLWRVCAEPRC